MAHDTHASQVIREAAKGLETCCSRAHIQVQPRRALTNEDPMSWEVTSALWRRRCCRRSGVGTCSCRLHGRRRRRCATRRISWRRIGQRREGIGEGTIVHAIRREALLALALWRSASRKHPSRLEGHRAARRRLDSHAAGAAIGRHLEARGERLRGAEEAARDGSAASSAGGPLRSAAATSRASVAKRLLDE